MIRTHREALAAIAEEGEGRKNFDASRTTEKRCKIREISLCFPKNGVTVCKNRAETVAVNFSPCFNEINPSENFVVS